MQQDDQMQMAVRIAKFLEQIGRQSQETNRINLETSQQLERVVNAAPDILRRSVDATLGKITDGVVGVAGQGLNGPMDQFNRQMIESGNRLTGLSHSLSSVVREQQALVNKLLIAVVSVATVMVLTAVGGVWLGLKYKDEIRENQISADLLKAYDQADVQLCDGGLCARVDKGAKKYGAKGEYVRVKPR